MGHRLPLEGKPKSVQLSRYVVVCSLALVPTGFGQPRVDAIHMHERVIAVVPIIGAGTYQDPHRPLFAPAPTAQVPGLISWSWEASDDGKLAIVEFVAKDKAVLRPILGDSRVVKAFEKGKARLDEMEKELRKYRKDYSFRKDAGRPQ